MFSQDSGSSLQQEDILHLNQNLLISISAKTSFSRGEEQYDRKIRKKQEWHDSAFTSRSLQVMLMQ